MENAISQIIPLVRSGVDSAVTKVTIEFFVTINTHESDNVILNGLILNVGTIESTRNAVSHAGVVEVNKSNKPGGEDSDDNKVISIGNRF